MNDNKPNIPELMDGWVQKVKSVVSESMPDSVAQDIKKNVLSSLSEVIEDLDLVSREELEIQNAVLQKTREKVDKMEQVIAELEKQLKVR